MTDITVQELKEKMDNDEDLLILDVREPFEKYQSDIDYSPSKLIPIGELTDRVDELEEYREKEIVCLCRSGGRSENARKFLKEKEFEHVKNLKGGINEWARKIDTSLPVY
ncbi:MAG: rhodanese-like domain-containing protein [Balneolaceae bacterium]|nr:rhodanese-like domain-containing protein [Balneolaceae bacterium]